MDIEKLIDDYSKWLKEEITFEKIGEYYEITTPYLDNANDYLQFYVKQEGDEVYFTDDSAIIHGLKMNGVQLTPSRKSRINRILNQFGVQLNGDEIIAKAPIKEFAPKKHSFVQAMLHIDDMFTITKARVATLFIDNIQSFFKENEIYYSDNVQFTGISGFIHSYDFLMQRNKTMPERLCQAVNNPSKSNIINLLFAWNDTKPARNNDSELVVILNDQNVIEKGVEDALGNYEAKVIRWSERNDDLSVFTA